VIIMAEMKTGKFVKVKCPDCGNEQIAFRKPSTPVVCHVCGSTLIEPAGGAGKIRGELLEVVG
jgi:small subunit ribosomal protein S27e